MRGEVDVTSTLLSLGELRLEENCRSDHVAPSALRSGMLLRLLLLHSNQFSGPNDLRTLPRSLKQLSTSGNNFTGGLNLSRLPP